MSGDKRRQGLEGGNRPVTTALAFAPTGYAYLPDTTRSLDLDTLLRRRGNKINEALSLRLGHSSTCGIPEKLRCLDDSVERIGHGVDYTSLAYVRQWRS